MIFKNYFLFLKKKDRSLYLNSNTYNRKISLFSDSALKYKPSPSLLDCLIKYKKKRINIDNYTLDEIWIDRNLIEKDYDNLNSFFWLFSLDLKSSKKETQNIILKWIPISGFDPAPRPCVMALPSWIFRLESELASA